jgi:ATP-dependent Clp protease ATP-binding subunit ClpC
LKKAFSPEFLNRIDDIIVFNSLEKNNILQIISIELDKLTDRLEKIGYSVSITERAKEFISEKGFDKDFGARPLKRAIQKHIEDPIAEEIINSEIHEGDDLLIDVNENGDGIQVKVVGSEKV